MSRKDDLIASKLRLKALQESLNSASSTSITTSITDFTRNIRNLASSLGSLQNAIKTENLSDIINVLWDIRYQLKSLEEEMPAGKDRTTISDITSDLETLLPLIKAKGAKSMRFKIFAFLDKAISGLTQLISNLNNSSNSSIPMSGMGVLVGSLRAMTDFINGNQYDILSYNVPLPPL